MTAMVGKTILQLALLNGEIDRENSYLEIHVEGQSSSQKIPLSVVAARGLSAKEVIQISHPEVISDQDFINFISGTDGKDAYEVAVEAGFVGTKPQWLASLKGADGIDGVNGKSAYQLAVDAGYPGSVAEWLTSIKGEKGDSGTDGTNGTNGKSAYQQAVDAGFPGSESQWLASLIGKSAYQAAVDNGYIGTPVEWLASLKGVKGDKGDQGTAGTNAVLGNLVGSVATPAELPAVGDFEQADYFMIGTHIWMNLNGEWVDMGDFQGPPGRDGSGLTILGELPGVEFLPATGDEIGDAWLIAKSMYVWNGTRWQEQGQEGLQGPKGDTGDTGASGKSSFEVVRDAYPAIDTMAKYVEFIRGLKGDKGDTAISFVADGTFATVGELPATGTDNHGYLIGTGPTYDFHVWVGGQWVNMGNNVGPKGDTGDQGEQGIQGPVGRAMTPKGELANTSLLPPSGNVTGDYYSIAGHFHAWDGAAWIDIGDFRGIQGVKGDKGDVGSPVNAKGILPDVESLPASGNVQGDAYEINGNIWVYGTSAFVNMGQWRGTSGLNGKSAYQSAVDSGFVGTEAQWTASLVGEDGTSMTWLGLFNTVGELPATPAPGSFATVNGSPPHLYIWNQASGWVDNGTAGVQGPQGIPGIQGVKGDTGEDGVAGKSAYQVAVDSGFVGDVNAWLLSLKGQAGDDGRSLTFVGDFADQASLPAGTNGDVASAAGRVYIHNNSSWVDSGAIGVKGDTGNTGDTGKSAYELAVQQGFVGDLTAWLNSLHGANGEDGAVGKSLYQDAVDRGLFQGTFPEFLASQKGDTGASAYEDALTQGTIPPGSTFAEFIEAIRGPQGIVGETGPSGQTGPAISIIGTLTNQSELPATGTVGTGYAIPDAGTPGTFDCWIWLSTTSEWFNLGHVVGAQGPKGDQGTRGLQGVKGDKGDTGETGTLWIVLDRDPQANDGRINDYFFNSATQEFFRKTGATTWATLGHIGGGNLNTPSSDGNLKGILDGAWVDLPLLNDIPADANGVYQLVNGQWVKFDIYTLKVLDVAIAGNAGTVDWALARQFRITNNTTGAKTITLTGIPAADRAATVVVKVYGQTAAFSWAVTGGVTIRWFDGSAPTFTNPTTTIVFNWDGQELVGSVPN